MQKPTTACTQKTRSTETWTLHVLFDVFKGHAVSYRLAGCVEEVKRAHPSVDTAQASVQPASSASWRGHAWLRMVALLTPLLLKPVGSIVNFTVLRSSMQTSWTR
jgi:hypothetical protein